MTLQTKIERLRPTRYLAVTLVFYLVCTYENKDNLKGWLPTMSGNGTELGSGHNTAANYLRMNRLLRLW